MFLVVRQDPAVVFYNFDENWPIAFSVCICACVVLQRKKMLMYRNIICFFSFPFITQNVRVKVRESRRWLRYTQRRTVQIFYETSLPFSSSGRNLCGYIIFWTPTQIFAVASLPTCYLHVARGHASFLHTTHANSHGHTFNLLPSQCTWSRFLLAWHSCNLRQNTCIRFTLGTKSISCFYSQWATSFLHATHAIYASGQRYLKVNILQVFVWWLGLWHINPCRLLNAKSLHTPNG